MRRVTNGVICAVVLAGLACWWPTSVEAASATLQWDPYSAPLDFKEFRFYRSIQSCDAQGPLEPLMIDGQQASLQPSVLGNIPNTWTDLTVPAIDGEICYEITAMDTDGNESPHSNRARAAVRLDPPPALGGLTIETVVP